MILFQGLCESGKKLQCRDDVCACREGYGPTGANNECGEVPGWGGEKCSGETNQCQGGASCNFATGICDCPDGQSPGEVPPEKDKTCIPSTVRPGQSCALGQTCGYNSTCIGEDKCECSTATYADTDERGRPICMYYECERDEPWDRTSATKTDLTDCNDLVTYPFLQVSLLRTSSMVPVLGQNKLGQYSEK